MTLGKYAGYDSNSVKEQSKKNLVKHAKGRFVQSFSLFLPDIKKKITSKRAKNPNLT